MVGVEAASTLLVFTLSLRFGMGGIGRYDLCLTGAAVLGVSGWAISSQPVVATACVVAADAVGVALMLPKTWRDPWSETLSTYALAGTAGVLSAGRRGRDGREPPSLSRVFRDREREHRRRHRVSPPETHDVRARDLRLSASRARPGEVAYAGSSTGGSRMPRGLGVVLSLAMAAPAYAQTPSAPAGVTVLKAARLFDGTRDTTVARRRGRRRGGAHQGRGRRPGRASGRHRDRPGRRDAAARLHRRAHPPHRRVERQLVPGRGRGPAPQRAGAGHPRHRVRAAHAHGRLHHRARRGRAATSSTWRCATRSRAGVVPGPRMLVAGQRARGARRPLRRHGLPVPALRPRDRASPTASPAVPTPSATPCASQVKYGADVIKVCATGGVLSLGDEVDTPQLTQAEMDAIVDEAHRLRKKTAAHAHGAEGAKVAIRAGIDSIEHGSFLDDEAAADDEGARAPTWCRRAWPCEYAAAAAAQLPARDRGQGQGGGDGALGLVSSARCRRA